MDSVGVKCLIYGMSLSAIVARGVFQYVSSCTALVHGCIQDIVDATESTTV